MDGKARFRWPFNTPATSTPVAMQGLYRPPGKLVWMFRYSRGGRQRRISTKTRDEAAAIRFANDVLHKPEVERAAPHVMEIRAYLAAQRKADRLSAQSVGVRADVLPLFFEHAGKASIEQVTTGDVQRWYDSLHDLKEDTRQTYVRWVRAFFRWLVERGRLRVNPCLGIKLARLRPVARKRTLSKKEVAKLLNDCRDDSLKFILFCGFHAGLRKEEVIEARPEWFNLKRKQIHIDVTPTWIPKDRERRDVPISKKFLAFLKRYGTPSPYVLKPEVKKGKAKYRYDFRRPYNAHLKACGLKVSFHDARRSFASQLVSAGVSVYKVAVWLGDGVRVVEKHYGHLQPDNGDLERGLA